MLSLFRSTPHAATFLLIALNVAVSLVGFWELRDERYRDYFVFVPSRAGKNWVGTVLSHFSHGDFGHLFVNMLALYLFGPEVEAAFGPIFYAGLYAASGLVGTFAIYVLRRSNPRHAALGASGSISGIVFASVVVAPSSTMMFAMFPVPLPAPVFALIYLGTSMLMMNRGDRVAHEAHIGGAVTGFLVAGLLLPAHFEPLIRVVRNLIS